MKYRLHPKAWEDLRDAADFYSERAGHPLARTFLAAVEAAIQRILDFPGAGPEWRHGTRRMLLRRFPYSLIYRIVDGEIRVLAVAHQSRRPGFGTLRS